MALNATRTQALFAEALSLAAPFMVAGETGEVGDAVLLDHVGLDRAALGTLHFSRCEDRSLSAFAGQPISNIQAGEDGAQRAADDEAGEERESVQAEDEETWGVNFYKWLLEQDELIESKYYLIRQSTKFIPHSGDDDKAQKIRALSKIIADSMPAFTDLRVKIHGRPENVSLHCRCQSCQQFYKSICRP